MSRHQGFLAIGLAAVLGGSIMAKPQTPSGQQKQTPLTPRTQTMSMPDMMKSCQEHCQATSKTIDQLTRTIEEAKTSNDPAKMRAALDQAQQPLTDMKEHMNMCRNMMGMMQKMHGMGGMMGGGMMSQGRQSASGGADQKSVVDIAFTSEPNPPRMGENTFEVTVKAADGTRVTDAEVALNFYMAAMPSMNMSEMRNTVRLQHVGGGRYRGTGNVAMAGRWDVTVVATKAGEQIGSRTVAVTAK